MTRSLKSEMTVQVGNYLATRRGRAFSIAGCAAPTKDRRFTLVLLKKGTFRLSGSSSSGERLRKWIKALSLDEAIAETETLLFGNRSEPVIADLSVATVCSQWLETRSCSKDGLRCYRQFLGYFIGWLDKRGLKQFPDIRPEHLQRYAKELAEGDLAPKTVKHYCYPARAVARWASLNWPQVTDFSAGFRLPKTNHSIRYEEQEHRSYLSLEEALEFLKWLSEQTTGWGLLPGIALQALCGLRVREAIRLLWSRVDLERGTITVDGVVKNAHSVRRIPIPQVAIAVLSHAPKLSERVIHRYDHSHAYGKAVARALKGWRHDLVLEPKGLRRTIPTESGTKGWNRFALERYIGHSPAGITELHYIGSSAERMENLLRTEIVNRVDAILTNRLEEWQQEDNTATGLFTPKSFDSKVLQLPIRA